MRWKRRLSSDLHFAVNVIASAFAVLLGLAGGLALLQPGCGGSRCDVEQALPAVLLVVLGVLGLVTLGKFVRVVLEEKHLVLSTCWRTIRVPLDQVREIRAHRIPDRHVSIEFTEPTRLGRRITFVPAPRTSSDSGPNEVVTTLQRLLAESKSEWRALTSRELTGHDG